MTMALKLVISPSFFQYALYVEPSHSCSVASSTVRQSVSSILKGSRTFLGMCNKISRYQQADVQKLCQTGHFSRSRNAQEKACCNYVFHFLSTKIKPCLEISWSRCTPVRAHEPHIYKKTQTVLLYALGQSAKDSKVLLWFSYHYCNGYCHSRLNFLGFSTSGTISILLSPQSVFKVSLWYSARATWHYSPGSVSHVALCAQGILFAEERQTREEWLEKPITPAQRSASGCAANGRQSMVLVSPSSKPQTTNSCYSADAKKHTTQTNFLKTAFWVS